MRLIVECEHDHQFDRWGKSDWCPPREYTDPDAILAALAEAGVLEVERAEGWGYYGQRIARFVSPWKEAK